MSDSSYGIRITTAMQKIADRFKSGTLQDTNPQDGSTPPFKNQFPQKVAAEKNLKRSNGPADIIDVSIDYRGPILYLCNQITRIYPKLEFKDAPALTPTSLLGYSLGVLYSLALLNDDENVRTKRSVYAREFSTDAELSSIIDDLRNLAVPPFMFDLIKQLGTTSDDRKSELHFVHSQACFDYKHDFGRTFPINIFFIASHIIASQPSNTHPEISLRTWYQTTVMETPEQRQVYHYLGTNPAQVYETNWFSNVLQQLYNPVTSRSNTLRPTLDVFNQGAQTHPDVAINNLNPYIYLLALDTTNRTKVSKTLNMISQSMFDHIEGCKPLGELQREVNGSSLMNHYIQNVLRPTYHHASIEVKEGDKHAPFSIKDKLKYLGTPKYVAKTPLAMPPSSIDLHKGLLLMSTDMYTSSKDPIKFEMYSDRYPPTMNIRHFLPLETRTDYVYQNIISGKLIETSELDSVAVPHPNPNNTVDRENSYFLESAIPISRITPIMLDVNAALNIVSRDTHDPMIPTVRCDLLDRSVDRIPLFGPDIVANIPEVLPGYKLTTNLSHTQFGCNSICYTLPEPSTTLTALDFPREIHAWSSYRYLNTNQHHMADLRDMKYMLLNLRTMFGTNVTLIETPHPSVCILQN